MSQKVLIIDDDLLIQGLIQHIITSERPDYICFTASDGDEGLKIARKELPDVILTDFKMPGKNGVEVIKKLKEDIATAEIPVIMVTRITDHDAIRNAFDAGAMYFLEKPIDSVELIARLNSAVKIHDKIVELENQKTIAEDHAIELEKLSIIARETNNSVVLFSKEGNIEWANDGFRRLYGYTIDEFKNRFGQSLFETSSSEEIRNSVRKLFRTHKPVTYVAICKTKKHKKWVQTTLTPIFDDSGVFSKFIAIESDITKIKKAELEIRLQKKELERAKQKSDQLLLNILPAKVAEELKEKGKATPRHYSNVTVLFADFTGFTQWTERLMPEDLISLLNSYFSKFDDISDKYGLEKIKTIGDAYMCVSGIPTYTTDSVYNIVRAALEIRDFVDHQKYRQINVYSDYWDIRLGIHIGDIIAGVVGKKKFAFDIWGDTVNIASRIESYGKAGEVNISDKVYRIIRDRFNCIHRGNVEVKGKGFIELYMVDSEKKSD